MKRQILFRGWSELHNKWVEGNFTYDAIGGSRIIKTDSSGQGLTFIPIHPDSVGQFTGLLDCNGVKIFEGDKLQWTSSNPFSLGEIRDVQVNYVQAQFWCYGSIGIYLAELLANEKVKITGNTFQPK
jgi:hypothetical protein